MSKELNIAEILKDKPQGTKLYSPICGKLVLDIITPNGIFCTTDTKQKAVFMEDGSYKSYGYWGNTGECLLFPSKNMRDWEKFAWKQGDVLADGHNTNCMFDGWSEDDYAQFNTAYSISTDTSDKKHFYEDEIFNAEDFYKIGAYGQNDFIADLEKKYGGRFNPGTLKVEKSRPKFKDGDVIYVETKHDYKIVAIFKKFSKQNKPLVYVEYFLGNISAILADKFDGYNILCDKEEIREIRLASEEEKQVLFSKLEEIGKKWNFETKQVEDLHKKYEFKPFDKVLVRDNIKHVWETAILAFYDDSVDRPYKALNITNGGSYYYPYCIPFEGNEELVGTSNKPKEGGKK